MCSSPPDASFLADDVFYSNALHVLAILEIPLHLFGAFIVLTRTPQKMANVKWNMMILHCAGAISDVYLSLVAIPSLALPVCAGYPLGVSVWLGIPTGVQVYLGFTLACVVTVAVVAFFEDRFHVFGSSSRPDRSWLRHSLLAVNYLIACLFMLPPYLVVPDQDEAKAELLSKIPCYPRERLHLPGFFVLSTNSSVFLYSSSSAMLFCTLQLVFFAVGIVYRLFRSSSSPGSKSKNLIRLQKQFMAALAVQVTVPVVVMLFPGVYIMTAVSTRYYNQELSNVAMIVVALHGLASTVTMLIVHKPYRDATMAMLFRVRKGDPGSEPPKWAVPALTIRTGTGS